MSLPRLYADHVRLILSLIMNQDSEFAQRARYELERPEKRTDKQHFDEATAKYIYLIVVDELIRCSVANDQRATYICAEILEYLTQENGIWDNTTSFYKELAFNGPPKVETKPFPDQDRWDRGMDGLGGPWKKAMILLIIPFLMIACMSPYAKRAEELRGQLDRGEISYEAYRELSAENMRAWDQYINSLQSFQNIRTTPTYQPVYQQQTCYPQPATSGGRVRVQMPGACQ